jgi:hypothetical protein
MFLLVAWGASCRSCLLPGERTTEQRRRERLSVTDSLTCQVEVLPYCVVGVASLKASSTLSSRAAGTIRCGSSKSPHPS